MKRRDQRRLAQQAAALAAALLWTSDALADRWWVAGSGSWNSSPNWSATDGGAGGASVPNSLHHTFILHNDATNRTITYNGSMSATSFGLSINNTGAGTATFNQSANSLSAGWINLGQAGDGTYNHSGGTVSLANYLALADVASGVGTYNLSPSGVLTISATNAGDRGIFVGHNGTGLFNQTGGNVTINNMPNAHLRIGTFVGSNGTYTLNGGSATFNQNAYVGGSDSALGGNGILNVQTGSMAVVGTLKIWNGGSTQVNLSGGALSVGSLDTNGNTSRFLGNGTSTGWTGGTLQITGSTFNINPTTGPLGGNLTVSGVRSLNVSNTLAIDGGGQLTVQAAVSVGNEHVGVNGVGSITQSSGNNQLVESLQLGVNAGGDGTYTLSGGSLSADVQVIGYSGTGTVHHSGGTSQAVTFLVIGADPASVGNYNLSGTGSVVVDNFSVVGEQGTGTFTQTGGSHSATSLSIGGTSGIGVYALSAGTLSAGDQNVGNSGTGTFNQTGGSNTSANLRLGTTSTGSGTYTLSGGTVTSTVSQYIGQAGSGTFNHSAGTNNVTNSVILGFSAGGNGNYTLSSGATLTAGGVTVTRGLFTHSGGTANLSSGFRIGGPAAVPVYALTAGTLTAPSGQIGDNGPGTFNQSGGIANMAGFLTVGYTTGAAPGTYNLSGGELNAFGMDVGHDFGIGVVNQTGGVANVLGVNIAYAGPGTYNLSGGTLSASFVGIGQDVHTGILNVSAGGQLITESPLTVGAGAGSKINLMGGSITTPSIDTQNVSSRFNWTGGTLHLTDSVTFGLNGGSTYGFSMTLGSGQNLNVDSDQTVGQTQDFTLNLNAGSSNNVLGNVTLNSVGTINVNAAATFTSGTFSQQGGSFTGLLNTGHFAYTSGPFSGRLVTSGGATFSAHFTASGGIENGGAMSIIGPRTITANGPGLDNFGTITLAPGQAIAGTALTNFGTLAHSGGSGVVTVSAPLTNYSAVGPFGTGVNFRPTGGMSNSGLLQLHGGTVSGSAVISNAVGGAIESGVGAGSGVVSSTIAAPLSNSGLITAKSNTQLTLSSFAAGNLAGGEIRVQNVATVNAIAALPNAGMIVLQGSESLLTGGSIANTGTIRGQGRVGNPINNTVGVVRAEGGTLTLASSTLTNAVGGRFEVTSGATLIPLAGLASNAGSIALTGGTFDNNASALANAATGRITGHGTLRTGGLTNVGIIALGGGGSTTVLGDLTSNSGGDVTVTGNSTATFHSPVVNNTGATFSVTPGSSAVFLAGLSGAGEFSGSGSMVFEAAASNVVAFDRTGGTVVELPASLTVQKLHEGALTVRGNATLTPGAAVASRVGDLDVSGTLDMTVTRLIVTSEPLGSWNGSDYSGVTGLLASGDVMSSSETSITGLAVAPAGAAGKSSFGGLAVAPADVLVMFTFKGDANLSGFVDADDYFQIDSNYGKSADSAKSYFNGDFNLDGVINGDDYFAIDAAFSGQTTPFSPGMTIEGVSAVPEPAGLSMLALAAAMRRRRRR